MSRICLFSTVMLALLAAAESRALNVGPLNAGYHEGRSAHRGARRRRIHRLRAHPSQKGALAVGLGRKHVSVGEEEAAQQVSVFQTRPDLAGGTTRNPVAARRSPPRNQYGFQKTRRFATVILPCETQWVPCPRLSWACFPEKTATWPRKRGHARPNPRAAPIGIGPKIATLPPWATWPAANGPSSMACICMSCWGTFSATRSAWLSTLRAPWRGSRPRESRSATSPIAYARKKGSSILPADSKARSKVSAAASTLVQLGLLGGHFGDGQAAFLGVGDRLGELPTRRRTRGRADRSDRASDRRRPRRNTPSTRPCTSSSLAASSSADRSVAAAAARRRRRRPGPGPRRASIWALLSASFTSAAAAAAESIAVMAAERLPSPA